MASLRRNSMDELIAAIQEIRDLAQSSFGKMLVFEHGMGDGEVGAGCVSHAHVHLIPSDTKLDEAVLASVDDWQPVQLANLTDLAGSEYLLFMDTRDVVSGRVNRTARVPSQHVRRVLAKELGLDDQWDWAVYPFVSNGIQTYESLVAR
jgi:diadenosine tetraphosphate (Ap4A) HIT family hydrolase